MQLRRALIALSGALVLGLAACGGGGSSDEEQIKNAVKHGVVDRNVKVRCEEVTTTSFVTRVYGDVAQCRKAEKPESDDKPPTGVKVSDVKVDGDTATATVLYEGGDTAGSKGTFELRKEGGDWRIDDLGVDLLRSQVVKGLANDKQGTAALRDPKVRQCVSKAFTDLPDGQLKRVAYAAISERKGNQDELTQVITPCLSETGSGAGSGSTSFLRQKFEEGIAKGLRKNVPQAGIDCVNKELRASVSEVEIQQTVTGGTTTNKALQAKVVEAIKACRATD